MFYQTTLALTILILLILFFATILSARLVQKGTKPISSLEKQLAKVRSGSLDTRMPDSSIKEFQKLSSILNSTLETLQSHQEELQDSQPQDQALDAQVHGGPTQGSQAVWPQRPSQRQEDVSLVLEGLFFPEQHYSWLFQVSYFFSLGVHLISAPGPHVQPSLCNSDATAGAAAAATQKTRTSTRA